MSSEKHPRYYKFDVEKYREEQEKKRIYDKGKGGN